MSHLNRPFTWDFPRWFLAHAVLLRHTKPKAIGKNWNSPKELIFYSFLVTLQAYFTAFLRYNTKLAARSYTGS